MTVLGFKSHLKEYFENISQVLCFKNAFFGAALMFMSLFFKPGLFIYGLLASLIGYAYSTQYRTPKIIRSTGLMTINGFFFGIAMATLFHQTPQFYVCLLLGAFAIPLVTKAAFEVLQHWKLNPLIAPYILAIWVVLLCSEGIVLQPNVKSDLQTYSLILELFPFASTWQQLMGSVFHSMSQIFFFQSADYGLCLLLLITAFDIRRGFFFVAGTALATLMFYFLSAASPSLQLGLLSCNAALVGLSLAAMPEKFSLQTILLFCVLSLFLTLAAQHLLQGFALPILSLPYVATFWFAMLSRVPRMNVSWAPVEIN